MPHARPAPALPESPTAYQHFIAGQSTPGSARGVIERRSPGHGVVVSTFAEGTEADARSAIAAAREAFDHGPWPRSSGGERQSVLSATARLIREHAEELALIECLESGKPIAQAREEMGWAAGIWDYAAALCRHLHGRTTNTLGAGTLGITLREPVGVCGLITPWNFPLLIISQKLPFALAAGCTAVVKPSEFTGGTTLRLVAMLREAGLPEGVCNVVTGYGDPVGRVIAQSDAVDLVSFTGSTAVGKAIAAAASGNLKKVALELGGKNPQLVFPDAEMDAVVDAVVHGVYFNMGECCNSGSRLIVHEAVADELVDRVVEASRSVRVGDPLDEATQVGAIINDHQQQRILDSVARAREQGARVVLGGEAFTPPTGSGRYMQCTVIDRVTPEMEVAGFEVFGPVLCVQRFADEPQALALANGTSYGLSASIWTRDHDRALRLQRELKAGTVWVNTFLEGSPELPFGGYRESGLGRELGPEAVLEYTETKTVVSRLGPYGRKWLP